MNLRAWLSGSLAWLLFVQSIVVVMPLPHTFSHAEGIASTSVKSDSDPYFLGSQTWGTRASWGALNIAIPETDFVLTVRQPLVALGQAGDWAFFAPQKASALDEPGSQGLYFVRVRELYQAAGTRMTVPFFYLPLPASDSEYTVDGVASPQVLALIEQESILITDNQGVSFAVPVEDIVGFEKNATQVMEIAGLATQEKQLEWLESPAGQAAIAPLRERIWNAARQAGRQADLPSILQTQLRGVLDLIPASLRAMRLPQGSTQLHGLLPTLPQGQRTDQNWGAKLRDFVLPSAWAADSAALELTARTALVVANCSLFYTAGVLLKYTALKTRVAHVQYFVLGTAITNVNLILDELTQGALEVGFEERDLRKVSRVLDQMESSLPELKSKRDAQLKRVAARDSGPSAQAAAERIGHEWGLLEQKLVSTRTALAQARSVAARATPSDEFKARRKQLVGRLGDLKSNLSKASGQALEFKTTVGIFGHVLTLIAQIPAVWGTQSLRYVLDRLGVAEHRAFRQTIFEKSFGFAQRTSDRTPINSTTVKLGPGVLNAFDTGNVGIQLYVFNPWAARVGGVWAPTQWLRDKIKEAFGSDNAETADYNMITLVGNLVAYIAIGAYSVAHDTQEILTQLYDREVKREFKDRGLDVESAEVQIKIVEEVRKRIRAGLLMRGFPTEEEFLFDANSTYAKMRSAQGYKVPSGAQTADHAQARPGRVREVLGIAIQRAGWAQDYAVQNGLQEIERDLELTQVLKELARAVLTPAQFGARLESAKGAYRQARKDVVALTIRDVSTQDQDVVLDVIMPRFGGDRAAALRAWSLMRKEWERILDPTRARVEREEILKENGDPAYLAKEQKHFEKEMNPESRLGVFGRWQLARALEKADRAELQAPGSWERAFKDALVAESGLTLDHSAQAESLLNLVEKRMEESWAERLAIPEFKKYFEGLAPTEQSKLRAIYQAEFFASAYTDYTINKKVVPAQSPAQPGLLQPLRQHAWVRDSRTLTVAARFVEGAFSNGRYQLGFWPKFYRAVPLFEDTFVLGASRSLKRFPVAISFGLAWSYAVWATAYVPSMFVLNFVVSALTVAGPWTMVNRMMDNIGVKQGSTVSGMALFSTIGSWATMWGMLLTPIIAPVVLPALEPVNQAFAHTGLVAKVRKFDPKIEKEVEVWAIRPHPALTLCKDLLRPVIDGDRPKDSDGDPKK